MKYISLLRKILVAALLLFGNNCFAQLTPLTIGTIPKGDSIIVQHMVTITGSSNVSNQGTVTGSNISSTLTNDPKTAAANDPTITQVSAASTSPSGTGAANPSTVASGGITLLTVTVTSGTNPASTGITVTGDLTSIGGLSTQQFYDDGTHGDVTTGDNIFSFSATVTNATTTGTKTLPIAIADGQLRSGTASISLNVFPNLTINDVSQNEGNAGTTTFTFTVSLSSPAPAGGVTFDIATADGTAIAPGDYTAKSLTAQTISQGNSTYTFDVLVNGDITVEPDETFFVNVTNIANATITDGQGQGTIQNDDAAASANPSGTGTANPSTVAPGGTTLLTVIVTPGTNPPSTGLTVTGDLSSIGGSATQTFFDNGTNGDVTPNDNIFSYNTIVSNSTTNGGKTLSVTIGDAQARTANTSISLTVSIASITTYYPRTTATDLSQTSNWTTDVNGVSSGAGTTPGNFSSPNQLFNINRNAPLAGTLEFGGGSNMEINSATLTLTPAGRLSINTGSTGDFKNNSVLLQSTALGTASIGKISGTLSNATNVTVERYIGTPSAKRAWRLLTAPLRSNTGNSVSIFNTWQEGGINPSGFGTLITAPSGSIATEGIDVNSNYSLKMFDGTNLTGANNTKTANLFTNAPSAANLGYFIFVRGDRNTSLTGTANTTLRATGGLQTGPQTFTTNSTADGFTLIGNPFASPVDFDLFRQTNSTRNIKPTYYFWDPNLNAVGGYVTVSYDGSSYSITPSGSGHTTYIQSGQAIFLQTNSTATGTASVTFMEDHKASNTVNNIFRVGNQTERLEIKLDLQNTVNADYVLADATLARYNNIYSKGKDDYDAAKLPNIDEGLGILRNAELLSIESRPLIDDNDTMFLNMTNIKPNRNYQFEINPSNFSAPLLIGYLEDSYLNTKTNFSLLSATNYPFTVNTNAGSSAANRFRIVFTSSVTGPLPISFSSIKAFQKNTGVQVEWNIAAENNVTRYEVDRSADGTNFAKEGTIAARANNNTVAGYNWFDADPFDGNNFYRIRAIETTGSIKYSNIVSVNIKRGSSQIVINPNPVSGRTINLQFQNQPKGTYNVGMFNNLGQRIYSTQIQHPGGSLLQTLQLSSKVTTGIYQLQVTNGYINITQKVICN